MSTDTKNLMNSLNGSQNKLQQFSLASVNRAYMLTDKIFCLADMLAYKIVVGQTWTVLTADKLASVNRALWTFPLHESIVPTFF